MKVKITGYRTGVFEKDGKSESEKTTISYQHMYIEKPLKAYRDVDIAVGFETVKVRVSDNIADLIENYINANGLPDFPVDVSFDMFGRVEDVNFYV